MVTPAIQQQAPTTAPRSQVSSGNRAQAGDDRENHDDPGIGDAFDALLAISRGTIDVQIESDADRAANQMFDAKGDEGGGDKASQLNQEYRSSVGDKSDRQSDARTGVNARGDSLISEANAADASHTSNHDSRAKTHDVKVQDHFASLQPVSSRINGASSERSPAEDAARFDIENKMRLTGTKLDAVAPPSIDTARVVGPSAAAVAAAGSVSGAGSGSGSGSSVAEEIGQLLGASRIGEVQGARATAAPNATDQRASSNDRQAQTSVRPKQAPSTASESKVVRENDRTPFDKLVGKMRLRMSENRSTAQLRLNPPELGRIRVDVRLAGDRLVVAVQAESESARELLSQRAEGLKATLKEHGIQIDRFEVVTNTSGDSPDTNVVGGDSSGAREFSRESAQSSSSPSARVAQGGANEDHDGLALAGIVNSEPTVAVDTRLDIRI